MATVYTYKLTYLCSAEERVFPHVDRLPVRVITADSMSSTIEIEVGGVWACGVIVPGDGDCKSSCQLPS